MTPAAMAAARAAIGADRITDDGDALALFGQDIFSTGTPVVAIARPASAAHVQALVAVARAHRLALVPRGAGMSYTRATLAPVPSRTIVLDMREMAAIRDVNARDMYVLVEPGCTWAALEERLAVEGLELPYRGPVSGRLATVGGGVSQNAIFYGSGLFGTAADSVIGIEVVTGTGELVRTGSFGVPSATPFLRHFGPDLTGLFTSDSGVMGVKTAIALRLRRKPAVRDAISFVTADITRLLAFFEEIGRLGIASQMTAMDVRLQAERVQQTGWRQRVKYVRTLISGNGSVSERLGEGAAMVRASLATLPGRGMAAHVFLEGEDAAKCARDAETVKAIAAKLELAPGNPAVALAMLRTPFGPVTGLAGGPGERWVPLHFILPHSRALDGMHALQDVLVEYAEPIAAHGIKVRHLLASLGAGAMTLEPMFLWKDRLTDLAQATLVEQGGMLHADTPPRPDAAQAVSALRDAITKRLDDIGALHTQLGRCYPYQPRLLPATAALFRTIHDALDPDAIMNPGALDTPAGIATPEIAE